MNHLLLSINVDHVATLRNARGGHFPDPVAAAHLCLAAGAEGITVHLREDRRHIRDRDVERMKAEVPTKLNLEMAATEEMVGIATALLPEAVCLVPEKRQELTTEGGLDILRAGPAFAEMVKRLTGAGIRTSIFIEADARQIEAAARIGANCVELHTGTYADAAPAARAPHLARLVEGARLVAEAGLLCHAGHGLDFDCIGGIAAIPEVSEVSIGHFLIGQSIFEGLPSAVRRMRDLIDAARAG
ncbi:pyridoxine 5'-phosphate synthase [Falsiroseomonas tokyonensis]|uniref:Pyridoxine 5'-phosphate synthase n=1 Tax=Falsiroseomonas tokyonensis TaxID=430521 RepID=A0ABV7BV23_9PROT|nr:pyridoxine 5'-phosphate synthase [Falsiroseomonas tokyonensis]MBU8538336.1 pyridoxine 5'-phosphate synthase [Falsiroseomonas tokyonensis]